MLCYVVLLLKIWTFSAFLYITETARTSPHIIFIMYVKMSETFIQIDSLRNDPLNTGTRLIRTLSMAPEVF